MMKSSRCEVCGRRATDRVPILGRWYLLCRDCTDKAVRDNCGSPDLWGRPLARSAGDVLPALDTEKTFRLSGLSRQALLFT